MNQPPLQPFDFAAAARVKLPLRRKLNAWVQKASELFVDQWAMISQTPITAALEAVDSKSFGDVQRGWANPCGAVAITVGAAATDGMLVMENKQLRVLLLDLLGGCDTETTDEPLTSIEVSMATIIFEMAAASFSEAWEEQEPITLSVGEFDPVPSRSRVFPVDEKVLVGSFKIQVGEMPASLQMVLPHDTTRSQFGIVDHTESDLREGQSISSERISTIEVELIASFGDVEVDMGDLAQLDVGDIIVLDKKVHEPVGISANGYPVFSAWPGRKLDQQVLKIETVLEPKL
jgi:flagellar motor switch protein FliM